MPLDTPVTIAKGLMPFFAVLFFVTITFLRGSEQVRLFDFCSSVISSQTFCHTVDRL
jgi:hypothetical protein